MTSKRGRKRNDNLPPNRARDVQRAFRARRAAHQRALEDRNAELEEENAIFRRALNLPPSNRPPLGKGPTGKDKPKPFDGSSGSLVHHGLESSSPGSPDSSSSMSPVIMAAPIVHTRPIPPPDLDSEAWGNTIVMSGHDSPTDVPSSASSSFHVSSMPPPPPPPAKGVASYASYAPSIATSRTSMTSPLYMQSPTQAVQQQQQIPMPQQQQSQQQHVSQRHHIQQQQRHLHEQQQMHEQQQIHEQQQQLHEQQRHHHHQQQQQQLHHHHQQQQQHHGHYSQHVDRAMSYSPAYALGIDPREDRRHYSQSQPEYSTHDHLIPSPLPPPQPAPPHAMQQQQSQREHIPIPYQPRRALTEPHGSHSFPLGQSMSLPPLNSGLIRLPAPPMQDRGLPGPYGADGRLHST